MSSNKIFIMCFTQIKISEDSAANYFQNNKENLQKEVHERYQDL